MLNKALLFEHLLNHSSDILIFFDEKLCIQEMNIEAENIFSASKGNLVRFFLKYDPDGIFIDILEKMVVNNEKGELPKTIFSYKNVKYVIEWKLIPLPKESYQNTLFLLKGINIVESYELYQETKRLKNIFLSLPCIVFLKDKNLNYIDFNDNFLKNSGFTDRKEVIGKNDFDFSWKGQAESFRKDDEEVLRSGEEKIDIENFICLSDGTALDVISSKVPLKDEEGNIVGVLGIAIDITQRKRHEKFLQGSIEQEKIDNESKIKTLKGISRELMGFDLGLEQYDKIKQLLIFLRTIVANMPGNVYWKDLNSVYIGGNDNVVKVCNLSSRSDIAGMTDVELEKKLCWESGTAARFRQDDIDVISSKAPKTFEDIFIQADGKRVVMLTTKAPIFDENKEVIGILATSLDITELKEREVQLQQAREAAELANRAKTDFLSNMSHDVKTPLSGMISFAEMLSLRVQPDLHDLIQGLMNASKQLMSFFENCIELSKIENYSIVLAKENFSLKHVLGELIQLFQPAIRAKSLLLYIDYSEKIPNRLLGSRTNLYRILLNLIGNALKFTQHGSIKLSVELSKKSTLNEAMIKLSITDTGVGIPEDKQGLIFEKFSRLTPSYQGTYEGHGIGLYIVQQFVTAMHGQIYVKSQEGKGSQFTVAIPFERPLLADDEYDDEGDMDLNALQLLPQENSALPIVPNLEKKEPSLAKELTIETSHHLKVLLVEDQPMAQMVAKLVLETLDCHVDIADCGQTAIALFEPGKYHAVFMDIGLPDMKGYEVSQRFRAIEKQTAFHVPILGLSAHASQEERELSSEAGMEEMLSKPLLLEQGRALLKQYVMLEC